MALLIDVTHGEFGTYKIKLTGSLDTESFEQLNKAVEPALVDPDARALRLEIQDLKFISSMGLGAIVKAKKAIEAKGGVLALIGAQPQVQKVFEIVRVLPKETIFASREEADAYLAMIQQRVLNGGEK